MGGGPYRGGPPGMQGGPPGMPGGPPGMHGGPRGMQGGRGPPGMGELRMCLVAVSWWACVWVSGFVACARWGAGGLFLLAVAQCVSG